MRNPIRHGASVVVVIIAAALVTSCAGSRTQPKPQSSDGARDARTAADAPDFNGPWADEFTSAYRDATSDFERAALSDEKVSDEEFSEMEHSFTTCLSERGVGFTGFKPGGAFDFTAARGMTNDAANKMADECSASSGVNTVGMLYFAMQQNPENLDSATIIAACLVKKRVVPKGYSAGDYNRDAPAMSFPYSDSVAGNKALNACSSDPLGLLGLDE